LAGGRTLKDSSTVAQFLKYSLAGGIATLVDFTVFSLAAGALGVNHILANTLSFTAGLAVNYLLSASWVFRTETNNKARDFAVFSVIGIIGLGLTNLLLYLFIDLGIMLRIFYFLHEDMILMLSKMITVAIVLVWNFSARKKFLFRANAT